MLDSWNIVEELPAVTEPTYWPIKLLAAIGPVVTKPWESVVSVTVRIPLLKNAPAIG